MNPGLLRQVSELDRADQMELVDFIYRQHDEGLLDEETKRLLDERLADIEANPDDEHDLNDAMQTLRSTWQRRIAS